MDSDEQQADSGTQSSTLASADGRYVVFASSASNLGGVRRPPGVGLSDDIYLRDRVAGTTSMVSTDASGVGVGALPVDLTPDGRHLLMWTDAALTPDDTDADFDHYVRDLTTGTYALASQGSGWRPDVATPPFAAISDNGSRVAFLSDAHRHRNRSRDYYDVYLRDLEASTTELVSVTRKGRFGGGRLPQISGNGRFVAFDAKNDNLVCRDTNRRRDLFVRDVVKDRTERVSVSSSGRQSNRGIANGLRISTDGRFVAYASTASNLVRRDTNRSVDVFVHDRRRDVTRRATVTERGRQIAKGGYLEEISASGRYVAFRTRAHVGGPRPGKKSWDTYIRDQRTGRVRYMTESTGYGSWTLSDAGWAAFNTFSSLSPADQNRFSNDAYVARWR